MRWSGGPSGVLLDVIGRGMRIRSEGPKVHGLGPVYPVRQRGERDTIYGPTVEGISQECLALGRDQITVMESRPAVVADGPYFEVGGHVGRESRPPRVRMGVRCLRAKDAKLPADGRAKQVGVEMLDTFRAFDGFKKIAVG